MTILSLMIVQSYSSLSWYVCIVCDHPPHSYLVPQSSIGWVATECSTLQENPGYQPVDARVKQRLNLLINQLFITDTKQLASHLDDYVMNSLFKDQTPPDRTNQRFFPTYKTLKNAIDGALAENVYVTTSKYVVIVYHGCRHLTDAYLPQVQVRWSGQHWRAA
jgi:hypothetical protein